MNASNEQSPSQGDLHIKTERYLRHKMRICGGVYGILMTLFFAERKESLTKHEIADKSPRFCDVSLGRQDHELVNEVFSNWHPSIRTLEKSHVLVQRIKSHNNVHRFALTDAGRFACRHVLQWRAEEIC